MRTLRNLSLGLNCVMLLAVLALWTASEFTRLEFAVNAQEAHYVWMEFNAVGGEFYIGYQRGGLALPFVLVVCVLLVWPTMVLIERIRRGRRRAGFEVPIRRRDERDSGTARQDGRY